MSEFHLLEKIEVLDVYSHKAVAQYPKSERHVLAAEIRETIAKRRARRRRKGKS